MKMKRYETFVQKNMVTIEKFKLREFIENSWKIRIWQINSIQVTLAFLSKCTFVYKVEIWSWNFLKHFVPKECSNISIETMKEMLQKLAQYNFIVHQFAGVIPIVV
jgi:hypothetical protein